MTENKPGLSREREIVRTSAVGIGANVLLAGFKAAVGLLCGSIAIVLDAVNNLSDAASSVVTIIGTRLAARPADREHPFGHGRSEYLSAMVIAVLVLYAGLASLVESVKKIIDPITPDYSAVSLLIVAAAVAVKLLLGRYVTDAGRRVNSDALKNSGRDAAMDAVISAATLAAALIYVRWDLALEAYLAAAISLFIIKSGVDMLRQTISRILGERADGELADAIRETVTSFPQVTGAYDLVLHNYGPDAYTGSIHVEVPDTCTAAELDELLRAIAARVHEKHHVILTAVGVYSVNTKDEAAIEMRRRTEHAVLAHEHVMQMHGFFVNRETKTIRFDVVVDFEAADRQAVYDAVVADVAALYPDYTVQVAMDADLSG